MAHHLTPPPLHHKRSFSNRTRQTISQAQHEINYSRFSAVQSLKMAVHKLATLVSQNQTNDLDEIRSYLGSRPSTAYTSPQTTPAVSIHEVDEYDSDASTIHSCDQVQASTGGTLSRDASCACGRVLPCWVHA